MLARNGYAIYAQIIDGQQLLVGDNPEDLYGYLPRSRLRVGIELVSAFLPNLHVVSDDRIDRRFRNF